MHIIDPLHPPSIDAPPPQKKRPRYTRSKAGCLTCRAKKIKCDEVKPICTRCEHAQRECTWPTETQRKKIPRRVRSSASPPSLPAVAIETGVYTQHSFPPSIPTGRAASTSSTSSASDDTGGTFAGSYDDGIASLSGSESGDDHNRVSGSGYLEQSYPSTSQSNLIGAYSNLSLGLPQPNAYQTGLLAPLGLDLSLQPPGLDYNNLSLPALSTTSSPSQVSTRGSPNPMYPQLGLPQLYPSMSISQANPNVDAQSVSSQLPPIQQAEAKWAGFNAAAYVMSSVNTNSQYPHISAPDAPGDGYPSGSDLDSEYYSASSASSLSPPTDSAASPEEPALAGYSSSGVLTTPGNGQWNNTPVVTNCMPDPIEPFFRTLKERDLIRHYARSSTELIMAVNTSAALNPVLATTLPIVLSVLPRTSASVEALRLSLLGVAAIHQSFLHSHSNANRRLLERGTILNIRAAKKGAPLSMGLTGTEGDQAAAESLRLALLLRQNASQCLAYAFQSLDGSWSDATLAASASIALIDIFAGGSDFESNLAVARQLVAARGGPENIIAANTPSRTPFGGGVTVSPARLLLEILAVYDVFGSLTTGQEPTYLGNDNSDWWLDGDDWSYHKYSVEKVFAMSRTCLNLVGKVSSLLSRLRFVEGAGEFTERPPDANNVPVTAFNIHAEATALLRNLEEEASSEAAHAPRFLDVGADEGTSTGGMSGNFGGGGLGGADDAQVPPNALPDYPQTTAQRIEHGTQAHMQAFQIVLLRLVFHVDRHDQRVQSLANQIIKRCHISATMRMPIDLTWPAIIAACELDPRSRGMVGEIFEGFRKKCCYDIDTAEQIVSHVWLRLDQNEPRADWKSVLEDEQTRVLLI